MRYHIIEKEPCCASQQNWPAKLDLSIRGPLCPRMCSLIPGFGVKLSAIILAGLTARNSPIIFPTSAIDVAPIF